MEDFINELELKRSDHLLEAERIEWKVRIYRVLHAIGMKKKRAEKIVKAATTDVDSAHELTMDFLQDYDPDWGMGVLLGLLSDYDALHQLYNR